MSGVAGVPRRRSRGLRHCGGTVPGALGLGDVHRVPGVLEVSIGHALVADALELGIGAAVQDYQRCIQRAFASTR